MSLTLRERKVETLSDGGHVFNLKQSVKDPRSTKLKAPHPGMEVKMPSQVNLMAQCSPIVDQGRLGSCTGCAIVSGLREFMLLKEGKPLTRLSRLFLYYWERSAEGSIEEDSGADIKDGMEVLRSIGTCAESLDPYDIDAYTTKPSPEEIANANQYRIGMYMQMANLQDIKFCLSQGYPVVMGMSVFPQMESQEAAKTGIVRMPRKGDQSLGGHCVLIVGYKDNIWGGGGGGYLRVRNSWGTSFGMAGYFILPYSYILEGLAWDFWTAR